MDTSRTNNKIGSRTKHRVRWTLGVTAAAALLLVGGRTFADDPVTMAPPVDSSAVDTDSTYSTDDASSASADSVFNWKEVPQDQQVPIRRAVFDRGGYQLYDEAGETIVVPFADQNLYVMKFAVSPDGSTYFINTGDAPVLYLPRDAYLDNAAVPGAHWYPFSDDFHPEHPVFVGIAPNWDDYCTMGWYPDMVCYGGYWGEHSFLTGGIFLPSFGLTFVIGGHHFDGWQPYHHYYYGHPAPYHVTVINRNIYRYGDRPDWNHRTFVGGHGDWRNHDDHAGRTFHNDGRTFHNDGGTFSDGGGRVFRGTGHPYYAHRTSPGDRDNNSVRPSEPGGHQFRGGEHSTTGNRENRHQNGDQGTPPAPPRTYDSGGGRTFNGGNSSHSFSRGSNGDSHSGSPRDLDAGRSSSGGYTSNGVRTFPSDGNANVTVNHAGRDAYRSSERSSGGNHADQGTRSAPAKDNGHQDNNHQDNGHQDNSHQDNGHPDGGRQNGR